MRFYSDWEKREGIKQAKPQRMFSWTITWEDMQLFDSEKEDDLGKNSITRLGQLLENPQLGAIKETCFCCISDTPGFLPNEGTLYDGTVTLDDNCDSNLTETSTDEEVESAFDKGLSYTLNIHNGLRVLDKDEWVSFWRRYNLIQFWASDSEDITSPTSAVINRDEIKELYPGLEDIVDILIDNNIPFSYDGTFELTNEDNEVIASAAMIVDDPKIAIDPFNQQDKTVFEQNGYTVIKKSEFNIEVIK